MDCTFLLTTFSSIMSVPEPPSILSRTVFYNLNGTRSEGICCHVERGFERVTHELSTIEKESIRVAILDPLSWPYFDSNENYEIARVFPNLKEIIFLWAKPENLLKYRGGDEKNKCTEEEDPADDIGQGERGFREYSRWEDKRKEFEDMLHAAFTDRYGALYHDRDSDTRIRIPRSTFCGIKELEGEWGDLEMSF
ncbi:hypothetical protein BELL_0712g00030 [Botrytis elliptica]|uniref:Uncharacterized protein n=1 Tax=Botrytis elliptica TaxID=278938 RepID=A0A4Z1JAE5_9HELO|nr:hypothetical protein EAE99_005606 [Botrytis elliptica]TGO70528.1 hypothetical protein BELL_0712g00030 [Botrytis elliptica]